MRLGQSKCPYTGSMADKKPLPAAKVQMRPGFKRRSAIALVLLVAVVVGVTASFVLQSEPAADTTFSGDVTGKGMIVRANDPRHQMGCFVGKPIIDPLGSRSRFSANLQTSVAGKAFLIFLSMSPWRGAGTYTSDDAGRSILEVSMLSVDGTASWTALTNAVIRVDARKDHGSLDAVLLRGGGSSSEHISGPWTCNTT